MKDDAIVLVDALDIMRSLPTEMQRDDQIMSSVLESLQQGQNAISVRQDALEIAQIKMGEAMAHGFNLVNNEIKAVKHEAEKERIHLEYARKDAHEAKSLAEKAWSRIHEVATTAAIADTKADSAERHAARANRFQFDPLTGMTLAVVAIVGSMILMHWGTSKKEQHIPTQQLTCGVEVDCVPKQLAPTNNRGST